MSDENVFVFRCYGGRCACGRRCEITTMPQMNGIVGVWIYGDDEDVSDLLDIESLSSCLADGEIAIENAAGLGTIEVDEPTAANLRNWLFHRGIVLPEPEPQP